MSASAGTTISIAFMGGSLVPGLPEELTLDWAEPATVSILLERLELVIGQPDLIAQLRRYFIFVVNGTAIQHLQGWETPIEPGTHVSVLAPMGGGAGASRSLPTRRGRFSP